MRYRKITLEEWKKDDYQPVVCSALTWQQFQALIGVEFDDYLDNMGCAKGAMLITDDGLQFMVETCLESKPEYASSIFLIVNEQLTENIEKVLSLLGVKFEDLTWIHDDIKPTPWELWRQDDNGNQALMKTCLSRVDASILQKLYEDRGHKQLYWIQECGNSNSETIT